MVEFCACILQFFMGPFRVFQPSLLHLVAIPLVLVIVTKPCCAEDYQFKECSLPYNRGNIQRLGYPFWGEGRSRVYGRKEFELTCRDNKYPVMGIDGQKFRILKTNALDLTMTIARDDLWNDVCPQKFSNTTLVYGLVLGFDHSLNIFYGCSSNVTMHVQDNFTCLVNGSWTGFYADIIVPGVGECSTTIQVPILFTAYKGLWDGNLTLQEALNQGFDVEYYKDRSGCSACRASGGICGSQIDYGMSFDLVQYRSSSDHFVCFCPSGPHPLSCHGVKKKIILALEIGASAIALGILLIIFWFRRKFLLPKSVVLWKKKSKDDQNLEDFIRNYGSLAPKRFSYSDIKKMTNLFRDKLGQGGYGSVYKGKLLDGRVVAVKILNASKGNGEEFINEVASISRTSHINIVSFLGFCFEGRKKALIYEVMPNGSLEKFIYGESPLVTGGHLEWEKLYDITLGIARGLEYLHTGCVTRILHFDIKPHNILLDDDFSPKIADFGLAKLCKRKESIVSMVGARGTIGYIAPEVFSRNFGGVSYKSDVYSYGMMVLEMVGGRKNVNVNAEGDHTSEIYFPHWIYKRLEVEEGLGLQGDMTKEELEITKKMILVGLWCIQTDPSQRPSMGKVIEMLEGSIEALEVPPKPYLSSPSRSPPVSYSSTSTLLITTSYG